MYGLLTPVQSTGQQTPVQTIPEHDPAASSSFSPLDLQTPLRPTTIVLSGQQTLPTLLQLDAESQLLSLVTKWVTPGSGSLLL